jgi:hypothetical protein
MKKIYFFLLLVAAANISFGQNLKPIAQKINERKAQNSEFRHSQLFKIADAANQRGIQVTNIVSKSTILEFNQSAAQIILSSKPDNLNFVIPSQTGNIELELYKANFFTPDFSVVTSSSNGQPVSYEGGVHYWGIIKGDNSSLAAISIFGNEIMGMVSSPAEGNFVLGKLENDQQGRHIFYNEKDLKISPNTQCFTAEDNTGYSEKDLQNNTDRVLSNCIRLYWEVNFDIEQQKGSVTNATNYVAGLFNQSAIIYSNDGIPVSLSQIFVWNTTSPYTSTSTSGLLSQFQSNRNSFNGDLGNLLGYAGGGGVAAGFSGLCSSNLDNSQCYCGISTSYSNVPTYSWSVEVTTHEQGHLMGSRHTHACVWNGNNTAIDGCGPAAGYAYEGSCSGAPIPPNGGTIMSYCHLVSVGINFSLGFGTQPKNVILNNFNNASCLAACGTNCGTPFGLTASSITISSATVSWTGIAGASTYNLQYKQSSSGTWTTVSGLASPSRNLTGLTDGTSYDFQVQAVCSTGTSAYSTAANFSTLAICNDNYEPNNTGATAVPITLNTNISGLINPAHDIDMFSFSNTSGQPNIQITLTNLPADYDMKLLKNGKVKMTSQNGGLTSETITYNAAPVGLYKIRIYAVGSAFNSSACYTLKTQISSTAFRLGDSENSASAESKIKNENADGISIYPNPANDVLNVNIPADENNAARISILDQLGREVTSSELKISSSSSHLQFDLSQFVSGIYLVRVVQAGNIFTQKLIISR